MLLRYWNLRVDEWKDTDLERRKLECARRGLSPEGDPDVLVQRLLVRDYDPPSLRAQDWRSLDSFIAHNSCGAPPFHQVRCN